MITVIDYGMGNAGSIVNMFKRIGIRAIVASDPDRIGEASGLILPGVGAFDAAMNKLNGSGLRSALEDSVIARRTPVLGICLGMQLLGTRSEEGSEQGLDWIPGSIVRIPDAERLKIPHMGWNHVEKRSDSWMAQGLEDAARYYFVHSYHMVPDDPEVTSLWCRHGIRFSAAVECGHIMGVQFHPEKSHRYGMTLLNKFVELTC